MKVKIFKSEVFGSINGISSKSIIHRLLILAALSTKKSTITNVDLNDDINATIDCLEKLGAKITYDNHSLTIYGIDLSKKLDSVILNANESGSTLRFLIPLATYIAKEVYFYGSKTLLSRPLNVYQELYEKQNLIFKLNKDHLYLKGSLKSDNYQIYGNISSQFISGLLFYLPLLKNPSTIKVIPPFESKPYVDLTVDILKSHQVDIIENNKYVINPSNFKPINVEAENDFSQAAFFATLASINNDLVLKNLNFLSLQGDKEIFKILSNLGVKLAYNENNVKIFKSEIKSGIVDLANIVDLGPILMVLALFSNDKIRFINVERLKYKESNRLDGMLNELVKLNVKVIKHADYVDIYKLENLDQKLIEVDSLNDHRLVMAFSVLATKLNNGLIINNCQAVNKSYPTFFDDLKKLNVKLEFME